MSKRTLLSCPYLGVAIIGSLVFQGCSSNDEPKMVDCSATDLSISLVAKTDPSGCNSADGSITVSADGGNMPYQFKINTGAFGLSSTFNNLNPGIYVITVRDANRCEKVLNVTLAEPSGLSATVTTTSNNQCLAPFNGSVTVTATGGSGNYQYAFNNGPFGNQATFNELKDGSYTIVVKDAVSNCTFSINVTIGRLPTGVVFEGPGQIKELLQSKCSGPACHPTNGELFIYPEAFNRRNSIKSRTQSGTMPPGGGLTADEKARIACWVDDGAPMN